MAEHGLFLSRRTIVYLTSLLIGSVVISVMVKFWPRHAPVETQPEDPPLPVNAVEVRLGRFQDSLSINGTVKGEAEIELRFEKEGKVSTFDLRDGALVKKGQVIATLDPEEAQLKLESAEIDLVEAERLNQVDPGQSLKLRKARLNLRLAQNELGKTKIVATRDGIFGDKAVQVGEFVTPQRAIGKLVSIDRVIVSMGVIEKNIESIFPGQKFIFSVASRPDMTFEGVLSTVSPLVDAGGGRTLAVEGTVKNPDRILLPGMFARAKILLYEADNTLTIPNSAIRKGAGGFRVFKISKDDVATEVDVGVEYTSIDESQISHALEAGDIVVVDAPLELKSGRKVQVIEVQHPL